MNKQKRLELKTQRLNELQELARSHDLNLAQYSSSHFRLFGPTVVDYWPGSGKCWVTGSNDKSTVMTPQEVVTTCLAEPLPPGAREHLKDLQSSEAVGAAEMPTVGEFTAAFNEDYQRARDEILDAWYDGEPT